MGGTGIILYLQSLRSPALDIVMIGISVLGYRFAYMVMLPLIYWLVDRRRGWVLALVFLLSMEFNAVVKNQTKVPRPFINDERVELIGPRPHTYAFPSGHAQGSMLIFGGLAAMYPSAISVAACGAVIFSIGLSRLYLGVHSPIDVTVGWLFGGLGLAAMWILFNLNQANPQVLRRWRVRLFWIIAGFAVMSFQPSRDTVLAGSTLAAVALLQHWERRWVGFDNCRRLSQRIARLGAGFIPAGVVLAFYKCLAFESLWVRGIFFFIMGGWMVLGAPFLFKRLKI